MEQEKRKHARYEIRNAVSVTHEGIYQIVDISNGGYRFKCSHHTSISDTWVTDIINHVIPLEGYPARKIWVSIIENGNNNLPFMMFVGVKFGKLKNKQKLNLAQVLQSISSNQVY